MAAAGVPRVPGSFTGGYRKESKAGVLSPDPQGRAAHKHRQMHLYALRGQAGSSGVSPGHSPVPRPPGPQLGDSLHLCLL